ncbi:SPW repeat domain-containing protein [Salinilacihabitans rarus]|uniref:SPW repeat domain-containing protein n=1 Tax=Salinilacihabitans rarus TaxID=2961596 RepID=UPI0020C83A88|nr:SPW repeat protein [Salinilacihabitans rarus]
MSQPSDDPTTDADATTAEDERASAGRRGRDDGDLRGKRLLSGFVSVIGLWIALSPTVYETTQAGLWNNAVVGAAIFLVAGYNFYRIGTLRASSTAAMALVALLGLWSAVAPFAIEMIDQGIFWSTVVSGAAIALLSAYVAYASGERRAERAAEPAEGVR